MKKKPLFYLPWLLCIFLAFVSVGTALCYLQMQNNLQKNMRTRLNKAVTILDKVLTEASQVSRNAEKFMGRECTDEVLTILRGIVAIHPYIRSVGIVKDHAFYCSTIIGNRYFPLKLAAYTKQNLILLKGNQLTPYGSLIVYNTQDTQGNAVRVTINGFYFFTVLKNISMDTPLQLQIGELILDSNGKVTSASKGNSLIESTSSKFEYKVFAEFPVQPLYITFVNYEWKSILIVLFISILSTYLISKHLYYRLTTEFMLKNGLKHKELKAFIQPIINGVNNNIIGGEILVRWEHPSLGFIPPDEFIPLAERSLLIKDITRLCFEQVIESLNQNKLKLPGELYMCFNISALNFIDDDIVILCSRFLEKLRQLKISLVLEITERELIEDTLQIKCIIEKLRMLGVKFSLDDFGTGHANYSYLKKFAPDFLKIDKMFTAEIEKKSVSIQVVKNMIDLAASFNCKIIAEGIENTKQLQSLKMLGISLFQGYYFGKPESLEDYTQRFRY